MANKRDRGSKPFFMLRKDINEELISRGDAEELATSPAKYTPGTDDDNDHFQLHEVTNFVVDNSLTQVITHPDKHKTIEISLSWDDQAGISEYEVWVGRTLGASES